MTNDNDAGPKDDGQKQRRGKSRHQLLIEAVGRMLDEYKYVSDRRGVVYRWNQRFWEEVEPPVLKSAAWRLGARPATDARFRHEIVDLLKVSVLEEELQWRRVGNAEVACWNGVLDLGTGKLRDHDPLDYLEAVLPWNHEPEAACPRWRQCLVDWFGSEEADDARALQDFFGYIVMPHARWKKACLLKGPGDVGKGVPLYVAQELVGRAMCCKISIEHMDDPGLLAPIKGKALNVMTELSSRALLADSGFKTLVSTEEPVMLNRKFTPVEMYTPFAKHIISTNVLPKIASRTAEIFNRLLIILMTRVIPVDRQDEGIKDKLRGEMPGILVWAIEGARRVIAAGGRFTQPAGQRQVLAEWQAEVNPMVVFVRENMQRNEIARTPVSLIAERWAGHPPARSEVNKVSRWLREAEFNIRDARPTVGFRGTVTCLYGFDFAERPASKLTTADFRPEPGYPGKPVGEAPAVEPGVAPGTGAAARAASGDVDGGLPGPDEWES